MTKLTLVSDYCYTEQPRDFTYYVYYKLQDVVYIDILDLDIEQADRVVDYIITHYNKMMYNIIGDYRPILIIEDTAEEGTLAGAVILLKEAARKAKLSAIQENELIKVMCGWAGQETYQQDPALPQGYEGRTVIPYPYSPILLDNQQHYRMHDIRNTPYSTEVCGIRIVLATDKRGYPTQNYNTHTNYEALGRLGCTAEEASQAMRRLSQAVCAEGQYTQALNNISHAEGKGIIATWQGIPLYDTRAQAQAEEEDSVLAKHTAYSIYTTEDKPVRVAYEGKDIDTQQHSDTYTHIQQEDTTHVYNVEDTHYYTQVDSVVDTHTLTHNDVVYDTQEIDTYIHSMIDIH